MKHSKQGHDCITLQHMKMQHICLSSPTCTKVGVAKVNKEKPLHLSPKRDNLSFWWYKSTCYLLNWRRTDFLRSSGSRQSVESRLIHEFHVSEWKYEAWKKISLSDCHHAHHVQRLYWFLPHSVRVWSFSLPSPNLKTICALFCTVAYTHLWFLALRPGYNSATSDFSKTTT